MTYRHSLAARTQFVLIDACGCPLKVMEGSLAPGELSAMSAFANGNAARVIHWQRTGRAVVHVSHEEWERRYAPLVGKCPHKAPQQRTPRAINLDEERGGAS